jgi:hypothetical protein
VARCPLQRGLPNVNTIAVMAVSVPRLRPVPVLRSLRSEPGDSKRDGESQANVEPVKMFLNTYVTEVIIST